MARSSSYTYDPKTGKWTKKTTNTGGGSSNRGGGGSSNKKISGSTTSNSGGSNLTSSKSNKNSSTGSTEKKYNYIEINTLSGTLNFIVTEETIKLKAGDTVKLKGLGSYLSGNYYVQDITRQISSNGYSHSATLIKTDFGKSLKTSTSTTNKKTKKKTPKKQKKVASSPKASSAKRTYTVKRGDCLWNIAKRFYGNGAKYTKIYDANTNKIANPNLIYPGQILVIP